LQYGKQFAYQMTSKYTAQYCTSLSSKNYLYFAHQNYRMPSGLLVRKTNLNVANLIMWQKSFEKNAQNRP
jgi:hypothetical protein